MSHIEKGGLNMSKNEKLWEVNRILEKPGRPSFSRIYPFTTENITGYIDEFELRDKSLLTVGSSGDQAINAILKGCEDITIVDICPFAQEFFALKKSALLTLTKEEYLRFFTFIHKPLFRKQDRTYFEKQLFDKVKEKLQEDDSIDFWTYLLEEVDLGLVRRKLFSRDEYHPNINVSINPYLQGNKKYDEIREKIKNISPTFIVEDIRDVEMKKTFDAIFLSNLFDYLDGKYDYSIIDKMEDMMNDGGKALFYYLYSISRSGRSIEKEDLVDPSGMIRILPEECELLEFMGVDSIEKKKAILDGALIYQKKKH